MHIKKKNIVLFLLTTSLIFFSSFLWNYIIIPFNENGILGEYLISKHHSLNDFLRYLYFVLTPLIFFLFFKIFIEKKKINLLYLSLSNLKISKNNSKLYIVNLLIIFLLLIEFLSISFPKNEIDIFHEGQKLSAAYKSLLDGSLWSGSFVTTGIINEIMGTKFIWRFFGHESIGSMRFLHLLYVLFFKISLILLIYEIIKKNFFSTNLKIIYFLLISLSSFFLIDYNLNSGNSFSYRDIPIIISLIIFFKYLDNINRVYFPLIFIGFLSVITFFWSIERAIIINCLTIFIFVYLFLNQKYSNIFLITISIIFFWLLSYFYLKNEFSLFLENTFLIFKNINYVFGIIHPTPFSDMPHSARATKSLLLIIISILISFNFLFSKKKKYSGYFKVIIITLSFVGFCSYISALGRSDGGHIKGTTGFLFIFFSLFIFYNLINYLDKLLLNKNFKINLFFFINSSLLIIFLFVINISINNILAYPKRLKHFIYLNDKFFLSNEQSEFVETIVPIIKDYNCLQLFTNDSALPYLLRKPNCSRYYFIYSLGSPEEQNYLINEMENAKLVIYTGKTDLWGYAPKKKLPLVDNYINSNYQKSIKILSWEIKFK